MRDVGLRIKKLREEKNMTQKQLADLAGITVATLSRYENDQRTPMSDIIVKIAQSLGASTDYLLTGEGEAEKHARRHSGAITVINFAQKAGEITSRQASIMLEMADDAFGTQPEETCSPSHP